MNPPQQHWMNGLSVDGIEQNIIFLSTKGCICKLCFNALVSASGALL
jgi:hypothetical protein